MEDNNNIIEENNVVEDNVTTEKTVVEEPVEVENTITEENQVEENNIKEETTTPEEETKEVESKSSKIIFRIVISIIILLILGLIGVLIYFNTNNEIKDDVAPKEKKKETVETNNKYEVSNNWKEYVISVYNRTLNLPTTYERVEALSGFKIGDTTNFLKPNSTDIINLYIEDKLALYVYVRNDNDKEIEYTEGKVVGIWQSKYEVETNNAEPIIFPGNLKVGQEMNRDTLVSLFGEPSDVRNSNLENYNMEDYYYYEDENDITEKFYRISVVNGKISDIYLVTEK